MMISFSLIDLLFTTCLQASGLITPHSVVEDDDKFAYKKPSFVSLKLLQKQKKAAQEQINFYTRSNVVLEQGLKSLKDLPVESISVAHYALQKRNNPYASYGHNFDDKAKIALMKASPSSLFGWNSLSESQMQSCYVGHGNLVKALRVVDEKQKLSIYGCTM